MRYLLDKYILLWHAENINLNQSVLYVINNPTNLMYVGNVTLWKIMIKHGFGKLVLNFEINQF